MGIFSDKKSSSDTSSAIPAQITASVSIMGDTVRKDAIEAAPVSSGPAPFGSASYQEPTQAPTRVLPEGPKDVPVQERTQAGTAPFGAPAEPLSSSMLSYEKDTPSPSKKMPKMNSKTLLFLGIGFLVLLIIGGIVFFFMRSRAVPSVDTEGVTPVPSVSVPQEVVLPPFALDKANYISFNTETDTAKTISGKILDSGTKMVQAKMALPVEFVVTDQNNNPLAFSRFAYLAELEVPADLLTQIDEGFSLFLYNDAGQAKIGLELNFKETSNPEELLKEVNADLPSAFQNLLYGPDVVVPGKAVFRSGAYGALQVFFVNVDTEKGLSFDYAVNGKKWFIGNSKNTLRVLLDKK